MLLKNYLLLNKLPLENTNEAKIQQRNIAIGLAVVIAIAFL